MNEKNTESKLFRCLFTNFVGITFPFDKYLACYIVGGSRDECMPSRNMYTIFIRFKPNLGKIYKPVKLANTKFHEIIFSDYRVVTYGEADSVGMLICVITANFHYK